MHEYMSKTERIQSYIKEVLADEKKHSTKEIIEYVDDKLKENGDFVFQVNSYVNAAVRILMKNEDYAKVACGMYKKGGIPYTSASKRIESESDLEKIDVRSAMVSVKAYAKVEEVFNGYYGIQIQCSGVNHERLTEFSYALAGYGPAEDYDNWFIDIEDEGPNMSM